MNEIKFKKDKVVIGKVSSIYDNFVIIYVDNNNEMEEIEIDKKDFFDECEIDIGDEVVISMNISVTRPDRKKNLTIDISNKKREYIEGPIEL